MDINRTGPRNPYFEDPAQKAELTGTRFKSPGSQPTDPAATAPSIGVASEITQADLRDPRKTEETLTRRFGDLVDNAGRQFGMPVSDAQKHNLIEFLGNDPVMRGKLLNYLEQVVK
jgi:hypothetical protein